jgi:multiple sugar transport system substrate-binding protein
MNKKIVSITIAMLVITSMILTACGSTPTAAPAATQPPATQPPATQAPAPTATQPPAPTATNVPVTLNIWHNWGPDDAKGPAMKSILADFMTANPDITIKDSVYVDADIPLKVETATTANQEPDLVFVQRVGDPLTWTDSGVTVPVNDYIKQWGLDGKFKDVALSNFTLADGKIQAFPMEGFVWPLWYNTKVFAAAGVPIPTTTDDLIADIKKIRAAGDQPAILSADGMGQYLFQLIIQSATTDQEAEQCMGKGDWTVPDCIKGVQLFVQLRDAGLFVNGVQGIDYPTANTQFGLGKIGMAHFGAWEFGAPEVAKVVPDVQLGGFPLPAGSPHKLPVYYSAFIAKGIWITPNGVKKIDAVKRFVQYIYQPDIIARFEEQAGMTSPLITDAVDPTKVTPLFTQDLSKVAEVAETPDLYMPPAVGTDFGRVFTEALTPGTTADKILKDLTAAFAAAK